MPEDPYTWAEPRPAYQAVKRGLDLVLAVVAITALSPVWIAIGIAIRATSRGPVLHRAVAVGRGGRPFRYYKFRTMVAGDDSHHREWVAAYVRSDAPYREGRFKVVDDPRITPVGQWLRHFSLDEVPQLLNVIRGDMSLVGPRPPLDFEFEIYDASRRRRLSVPPGITGLYQVTARSEATFSRMLELDLEYIRRRSIGLDLLIMLRTAGVMVSGRGAA